MELCHLGQDSHFTEPPFPVSEMDGKHHFFQLLVGEKTPVGQTIILSSEMCVALVEEMIVVDFRLGFSKADKSRTPQCSPLQIGRVGVKTQFYTMLSSCVITNTFSVAPSLQITLMKWWVSEEKGNALVKSLVGPLWYSTSGKYLVGTYKMIHRFGDCPLAPGNVSSRSKRLAITWKDSRNLFPDTFLLTIRGSDQHRSSSC